MAVIAVTTWFGLALQFYLMVIASQAQSSQVQSSQLQAAARLRLVFNYFSFFTILTNLLLPWG